MYSTTVHIVFISVIALASLFAEFVMSYPAKNDDSTVNNGLTTGTTSQYDDDIAGDTRRLLSDGTDAEDKFEDTNFVYQKCKRNKRHMHKQRYLQQDDATWEENPEVPPSPSTTPLTDEEILDIELQVQIARVKQKILSKLHLDRPPNVTAALKPQIPPQLARKVLHTGEASTLEADDAGDDAKTTQIIVMAENGTSECDFPSSSFCYRFNNPSGTSTIDEVISASIWLYILPDPISNSSTTQRMVTITRPAKHYGHRTTLASQLISVSEGWVEINIEHGMHRFVKDEQYVEVSVTPGTLLLSSSPSQQPKLELDVKNHERVARSTDPRRVCQPRTTQCCMQSYMINFAEIGWDFILEPTEYVANYCRGTCSSSGPFTFDHSQVASLKANRIRSRNRARSSSARAAAALAADLTPCCAPERLDSLSIMYLNSNNLVVVELLTDMVVRNCGCA